MLKHWPVTILTAVLSACQTLPLQDERLRHAFPQHGLTQGPDGWYMTRQTGPWGTSSQQGIWVMGTDQTALLRPSWAEPDISESDFSFAEPAAKACFVSTRPVPGGAASEDANIWCVDWLGSRWGEPVALPPPINSPAREWSPVIAANGDVYFASDRPGGLGLGDLYRAEQTTHGWRVTRLPKPLNSAGGEWNLDLSPDGTKLVFEASHRATNLSVPGDLYVSHLVDGVWTGAEPLSALNTTGSDLMPRFVSNKRFIFTSVEAGEARYRIGTID